MLVEDEELRKKSTPLSLCYHFPKGTRPVTVD